MNDFLAYEGGSLAFKDISLLKLGRHFRVDGHKVVIGRDHEEKNRLLALASDDFTILSPASVPGPVGLIDNNEAESLSTVTSMVARYSDSSGRKVQLKVSSRFGRGIMEAEPMPLVELKRFLIDEHAAERAEPLAPEAWRQGSQLTYRRARKPTILIVG